MPSIRKRAILKKISFTLKLTISIITFLSNILTKTADIFNTRKNAARSFTYSRLVPRFYTRLGISQVIPIPGTDPGNFRNRLYQISRFIKWILWHTFNIFVISK